MDINKDLQDKKEALVIHLYVTLNRPSLANIVAESGLLESTVAKIINKYLKNNVVNG